MPFSVTVLFSEDIVATDLAPQTEHVGVGKMAIRRIWNGSRCMALGAAVGGHSIAITGGNGLGFCTVVQIPVRIGKRDQGWPSNCSSQALLAWIWWACSSGGSVLRRGESGMAPIST